MLVRPARNNLEITGSICSLQNDSTHTHTHKHILYIHTPRSTVLREKLTGSQPLKKYPAFYGTGRFITAFTRACHLCITLSTRPHANTNTHVYVYLNIKQLDVLNFIMSLFHGSTCFEHACTSSGGQNCAIQTLVL